MSLLLALVLSSNAAALPTDMITSRSPSAAQVASGTGWHSLVMTQHGKVQKVEVGMYFNNNTNNKTFTINVADATCMASANGTSWPTSNRFVVVEIPGQADRFFTGNQICGNGGGALRNATFTIPGTALIQDQDWNRTSFWGARIVIRWVTNGDPGVNFPGGVRDEIARADGGSGSHFRFRFNINGQGQVGYINTASASLTSINNSLVHSSSANQSAYFPFGLNCRQTASVTGSAANVTVYDADNGTTVQTPPLWFWVGTVDNSGRVTALQGNEYHREGGRIWVDEQADAGGTITRGPELNGLPLRHTWQGHPVFVPSDFNNVGGRTTVQIRSVKARTHYVLVVNRLSGAQFIYVGLPGDGIFGSPDFDYNRDCPSLPTTGELDCSITAPSTIDTATSLAVRVNSGATPTSFVPGSPRATLNVSGPSSWNRTQAMTGGGGTYSTDFTVGTLSRSGDYDLNATVNYTDTTGAAQTANCDTTVQVTTQPYMAVYGGDAIAGSYEAAGSGVCSTNSDAGFLGWNTASYNGAGSQFAVTALGDIRYFASALNASANNGANPRKPSGLSFANTGSLVNTGTGLFGGQFSAASAVDNSSCSFIGEGVDLSTHTGSTANPAVLSGADATSALPGSVSTMRTIYATGNVYIGHDITYANSGGWTNLANIPFFKLVVVGGNIVIGQSVSQLDGLYVAEPDASGQGGTIYTCGSDASTPANVDDGTMYDNCNTRLVVNGAFAAKQVRFLRTYGTVGSATNNTSNEANAAEVFHYSPEMWLPRRGGAFNYDSISGLPPVL